CDHPPDLFDGTDAVRKALSAALRTGESFGAGHLIEILLGSDNDRIRARGHDKLPTFGVGRELTRPQWQAVFRQMMGHDLIRPDGERHGALVMTERARPILRGEEKITLRRDLINRAKAKPTVRALVSDEDAPLMSALKAKRRALAEAAGLPAYMIFPDRTLIEMAETRPETLDQMARVNGVGAKKLESYGAAFLQVILGASAPVLHPSRMKLVGRQEGDLFDQLQAAQRDLAHGADGHDRYLDCSGPVLRRIAEAKPRDRGDLARVSGMGEPKLDRFAASFLALISDYRRG
ncbi:MAG TPA: RQC domain-containing protein, partial [Paenirhodobacter sp.]